MQTGHSLLPVLMLTLGLFSGISQAESVKATLHGKVVSVPCVINGQQALDFDFGRVGIKRVDGVRYAVTQDVPVKCDKDLSAQLLLKVRGTALNGTQTHVLKTDVTNLGIALFDERQNKELPLNTDIKISNSETFRIKAIPVKEDPNKVLEAKFFTVTATVIAYYE